MNNIKEIYKNNLIYIFEQKQLIIPNIEFLVIIKDDCPIKNIANCKTMHYQDDFESLLNFTLPSKIRKTNKLISLQQCREILTKINYGVLSFSNNELPYSIGLNHIILDNRILFHCAKDGYKLNAINKRAAFLVIEDLGINQEIGTHNYNSVAIFGTVHEVSDKNIKKAALLQLVKDLAPKHPYHDRMIETTNILELEIDYIIGKSHIY